jgi:hypothetical protein
MCFIYFSLCHTGGHSEFQRRYPHLCDSQQSISGGGGSLVTTSTNVNSSTPDVDSHPTTQILPFLYLGNGRDACDLTKLDRLGISRVLNVTADLPCDEHIISRGIIFKQLPAADSGQQNLRQYFDDAYQFIGTSFILLIFSFLLSVSLFYTRSSGFSFYVTMTHSLTHTIVDI